ncbi:MAG: hypothetical protein PHZ07_01300 [Patescibacteria group bacterium]|nr:hypothetical protein [Patescibacteria group bacterium]MDD4303927.1 hypothetical protein [Patescibacteria group bacterium]MDD4695085.1 hypothetical protein [Patescibacteria group bacterium]
MKSLERRLNKIQKRNPYWNSYICFVEAIKDQGFSNQTIHRWFYKLVEKDDYVKNEVKQLLFYLECLSKPSDDNKF